MNIEKYLVISASEGRYYARAHVTLRDRLPKLKGNEISLKLRLEIPGEVIPKNLITPEVQDNIEKVIKETTGLNIAVSLVEQEDPKNAKSTTDESIPEGRGTTAGSAGRRSKGSN